MIDHSNRVEGINIKEIFPRSLFGKLFSFGKFAKWSAYIDKYLVFPKKLKIVLKKNDQSLGIVHIIDHSNAVYLKTIKKISSANCLITCHDLIAVRTALGEFSVAPQTSISEKRLQNWIKRSLPISDYFACDSKQTKSDLNRLVPSFQTKSKVIHLGTEFNYTNLKTKVTSIRNYHLIQKILDLSYMLVVLRGIKIAVLFSKLFKM